MDFHISVGKNHDVSSSRRSFGYNCVGCTERDFFLYILTVPEGIKKMCIYEIGANMMFT